MLKWACSQKINLFYLMSNHDNCFLAIIWLQETFKKSTFSICHPYRFFRVIRFVSTKKKINHFLSRIYPLIICKTAVAITRQFYSLPVSSFDFFRNKKIWCGIWIWLTRNSQLHVSRHIWCCRFYYWELLNLLSLNITIL